jgi:tRNA(Ile)-lysidine synthase
VTSSALHQRIRRTIRRRALFPSGSRVVVAVSGGSDSVALTLLLLELAEHGGFSVAGLAHLNHRIREAAARDEAFCREFASGLGLPIVVDSFDVPSHARVGGWSIEDAARRARYAFLERAATQLGADRIAVGHTEDDQAETFLLKLMRGAGATGLGGIYPRRGTIVRPLLDVSRAHLRAYLAERGQRWVEDETNANLDNPRNRVRHVVLGELDRAARGATRPAIARAAALIREDAEFLDQVGEQRFRALAADTGVGLELDTGGLQAEPVPIARRVVLRALRQISGEREVGLDHVEAVLGLLDGSGGGVDLPGCRVELRGGKVVLIQKVAPK